PILLRVAESIHWHAFYGPERTKAPARRILARLDRDLATRTVRAIMDAWGVHTWPIEETPGRPQHDADMTALCQELGSQYPDPGQLAQFLRDRLEEIARATGPADYAPAQLFLGRLMDLNLPLARHLMQAYLRGQRSRITSHTEQAL